jgi:putative YphP/YqiW family bacilliredoxin
MPMYPEPMIAPMRAELTSIGFQELRSAAEVDDALRESKGTALVVVNSMCGCAARNARPAIARALQHAVKPDKLTTVFAGQDGDATRQARSYLTGYAPSSPSIGLLKDGELVYMMERWQIEGRDAVAIAADLEAAFDRYCGAAV